MAAVTSTPAPGVGVPAVPTLPAEGTGEAAVDPPGTLVQAGARGAAWQGTAQIVGKGVVLLTTIVLARILAPEQFGLVSLALVLITYAQAVADVGVAQALVYLPHLRATTRAALSASLVTGLALTAVMFFGAPLIADFFDRPDVAPLARALAFTLLAASAGAVPEALLRRDLKFPRMTVATVLQAFVTGGVSIGLAVAGYGPWALAWGTVLGALAYSAALWVLLPTRPDLRLWRTTRADLAPLMSYGLPVAGGTLLGKLIFDVDYLIVGGILGAQALAFYTLAFRLPEFLIINVFFVLSSVTFPLYSKARNDPERLRRGYLLSVRIQSLYGVCAGVGLAVVAPLIVPLTFGEKWESAVIPLILLSIYAAWRSIGAGANDVYKALGRPGLSINVSLVRLGILVPALLIATHWGVVGVAAAQLGTSAVFAVLQQGVAGKVLKLRWQESLGAFSPALLAGAVIAVVGGVLVRVPGNPYAALALAVPAAVVAVFVALALAYRDLLRDLFAMAGHRSPVTVRTGGTRSPQPSRRAAHRAQVRARLLRARRRRGGSVENAADGGPDEVGGQARLGGSRPGSRGARPGAVPRAHRGEPRAGATGLGALRSRPVVLVRGAGIPTPADGGRAGEPDAGEQLHDETVPGDGGPRSNVP